MTSSTMSLNTPAPSAQRDQRVTFTRILRSEAIKLRSLRSSWLTLAATMLALVATGLIVGYVTSTTDPSRLEPGSLAPEAPLQGYYLGQLIIGVLGALFVCGEYGSGMIRSTFAAVPRRVPVVGAKAVVLGAVVLVAMTVASFAAFLGGQIFLEADQASSLGDAGALRAVFGTGVYLALIGLFGSGLAWIFRDTAATIGVLVGLLLVLPLMVVLVPGELSASIGQYLPSNAGEAFILSGAGEGLTPLAGLGVLSAWVIGIFVVASIVVRTRDA